MKIKIVIVILFLLTASGTILLNSCRKTPFSFYRPTPIPFNVPNGFPNPVYNFQNNPLTEESFLLGRKLFYDGRLSLDGNFPCSSCHQQVAAFTTYEHENLRRQIRQGIAGVLIANVLFGDDLGEMAANQTLLDLPKWLTDGYIEYAAEEWSPSLDNQLKSALLSGEYSNFYKLAFDKPMLAGHVAENPEAFTSDA